MQFPLYQTAFQPVRQQQQQQQQQQSLSRSQQLPLSAMAEVPQPSPAELPISGPLFSLSNSTGHGSPTAYETALPGSGGGAGKGNGLGSGRAPLAWPGPVSPPDLSKLQSSPTRSGQGQGGQGQGHAALQQRSMPPADFSDSDLEIPLEPDSQLDLGHLANASGGLLGDHDFDRQSAEPEWTPGPTAPPTALNASANLTNMSLNSSLLGTKGGKGQAREGHSGHFGAAMRARASGGTSPPRQKSPVGSNEISMSAATSICGSSDPIHAALMAFAGDYPVVQHLEKINVGFYKLEGHGTFELSLARTGDKLLVKQDAWNRGVRGEFSKFVQTLSVPTPPTPAPWEQISWQRKPLSKASAPGGMKGTLSASIRPGNGRPRSPPRSEDQKTSPKTSLASTTNRSPTRRMGGAPTNAPVGSGLANATKVGAKTGSGLPRVATGMQSTRSGLNSRREPVAQTLQEGTLFVHAQEPLLGDPVVLLRGPSTTAPPHGEEHTGLARLLCSGRTAELRPSALVPLEVPSSQKVAAASDLFEAILLTGTEACQADDYQERVFGNVQLEELTSDGLKNLFLQCWPTHQMWPSAGLIHYLRPFFIDWLQRRQRLRLLTELVLELFEEEDCQPFLRYFGDTSTEVHLPTLLMSLSERDMLLATMLATPKLQRSRLYALSSELARPLPLAYLEFQGSLAQTGEQRRLAICWEGFGSLLAKASSKPLVLSIGGSGAADKGKSSLLSELSGQAFDIAYTAPQGNGSDKHKPSLATHAAAVDLLEGPREWYADAHGAAYGDAGWLALMATLLATSSVVVLHLSLEDCLIQSDTDHPPLQQTTLVGPGSVVVPGCSTNLMNALGAQRPAKASAAQKKPGPAVAGNQLRLSIRPETLTILRMVADARIPGIGQPEGPRLLVALRDAPAMGARVFEGLRLCVEGILGGALAAFCPIDDLRDLQGPYRQHALRGVREVFTKELSQLTKTSHSTSGLPSVDSLQQIFDRFSQRIAPHEDPHLQTNNQLSSQSGFGLRLLALLDAEAARAGNNMKAHLFPVSEAATKIAKLKQEERELLEQTGSPQTDAIIAKLATSLLETEQRRRQCLKEGPTELLSFFVNYVLKCGTAPEARPAPLEHAAVARFASFLGSWRTPKLQPLLNKRRFLHDERLRLMQEQLHLPAAQKNNSEVERISKELEELEEGIEQLSLTVDDFWEELAAVIELQSEMETAGYRPEAAGLPAAPALKSTYKDWVLNLNGPVQLLFGSPLRSAGQFLVDVLRDLGATHCQDLHVISVIGVQSSAKSTLMNYLFGCGFATSAGRCTRGLYCSLLQCEGRTLLIMDTEGLMSLEAEGGAVFDAQMALMAMACSHVVLINHKGELSRQLQDLLEICLYAMQHLRVCRIQPKLLFVLRDQMDRSHSVHEDALRLMRKHLSEASAKLELRLDDLVSLDSGSVFLLPSAFASDVNDCTGLEKRWPTELFAQEAMRLRHKIFGCPSQQLPGLLDRRDTSDAAVEFSTLPDWCLHAMSVWSVLSRYGPNLLHYKAMQEIETQKEFEELCKRISQARVTRELSESCRQLLRSSAERLGAEASELVDAECRASLQALLDNCRTQCLGDLAKALEARRNKLPEAQHEEMKKKLQVPIEYQGDLARYTWSITLADALDRDQLKSLKIHFKAVVEELWRQQPTRAVAEEQAAALFEQEFAAFEQKCRERFEATAKSDKRLAEEVCLLFNHVLRQHRYSQEHLHALELVSPGMLLRANSLLERDNRSWAEEFLEISNFQQLQAYSSSVGVAPGDRRPRGPQLNSSNQAELGAFLVEHIMPEMRSRLGDFLTFPVQDSGELPTSDAILEAICKLNDGVLATENRFLKKVGVRLRSGGVPFLNNAQLTLRHSLLQKLVSAEVQRSSRQWQAIQSHRQQTEQEFMSMVRGRTSDATSAALLARSFVDSLIKDWLEERLVVVAGDIRARCLADMPDASRAAERAFQQSFVERNWEDVLEYVLDVNAYLHKMFTNLFEDRKAGIVRAQRPLLVAALSGAFDALGTAAKRWSQQQKKTSDLPHFQNFLRSLASREQAAATAPDQHGAEGPGHGSFKLVSERFPVVADFRIEEPPVFATEFSLQIAELLSERPLEQLVSDRLEEATAKQQAQVWALVRGCSCLCPCCGSKCDKLDRHTEHRCSHHLLPAFNGWRVAGTCEAALDACKSSKNHDAPKRSDFSDHLFANLHEYLESEHPEWLPFPKEDRELLADSYLKAAWVNCRVPLLHRYDMVDCTPQDWIDAYEEPHRMLGLGALEEAEARLTPFGYVAEGMEPEP